MMRNPLKVWASGTTPEGQTSDSYTPPLSRHQVNHEMPQVGVNPESTQSHSLTAEAPRVWVWVCRHPGFAYLPSCISKSRTSIVLGTYHLVYNRSFKHKTLTLKKIHLTRILRITQA